jgi:heptosyltransferase I
MNTRTFNKILVIRLGALGDLVHVSAALNAIKQHYPDTEIHFLSRSMYQDLVAMMPMVTQFWAWPDKPTIQTLFSLAQNLRKVGIDGVVNLHPSLKTFFVSFVMAKPTTIYRKEKCQVFGEEQRKIPRLHAVEDFFRPFQKLFHLKTILPNELIPELSLLQNDPIQEFKRCSFRLGVVPAVGGKRGNRAWPVENWTRLLTELFQSNSDLEVYFFGGRDDREEAQCFIESLLGSGNEQIHVNQLKNHCGQWDIPGTATLMKECDWVISGDTGPLHLAAAVNIPVIGLFGPTSVDRTGPRGRNQTLILTPSVDNPYWPCEMPTCFSHSPDTQACMRSLSVEHVLELLQKIMSARC